MKNADKEQHGTGNAGITPARITLTQTAYDPGEDRSRQRASPLRHWAVPLVLLSVIAIGVVFVLPGYIKTPAVTAPTQPTEIDNNGTTVSSGRQAPRPAANEISPFQQAQETRQRSRSQDLLSRLLDLQEQLENRNVNAWGEDKYKRNIALAQQGDAAYRVRDFETASTRYGDAVAGMQSLLANMETLLADAIARGEDALIQGNSSEAQKAFEFALRIAPDDETALSGLARAGTLDRVLALVTEGNDLQQNARLDEARGKYREALALDGRAGRAREQLDNVNRKINDREFNQLMSRGYRHLQDGALQPARAAFTQARKLKPDAAEVAAALKQTETGITNKQINTHLENAVALEQQEKWTEAVKAYELALALDANLAQAQEGRAYAGSRARLDERLDQVIAEPGRLGNKAIYEETRVLVQQARKLPDPGPGLDARLTRVESLLGAAMTPVSITLTSDNMTNVTLYKIGNLGSFEAKTLELLPGDYVAVGSREGYRDVRVEFSIGVEGKMAGRMINVTAVDKFATR